MKGIKDKKHLGALIHYCMDGFRFENHEKDDYNFSIQDKAFQCKELKDFPKNFEEAKHFKIWKLEERKSFNYQYVIAFTCNTRPGKKYLSQQEQFEQYEAFLKQGVVSQETIKPVTVEEAPSEAPEDIKVEAPIETKEVTEKAYEEPAEEASEPSEAVASLEEQEAVEEDSVESVDNDSDKESQENPLHKETLELIAKTNFKDKVSKQRLRNHFKEKLGLSFKGSLTKDRAIAELDEVVKNA